MDLPLENVKKRNIFSKTRIVVFSWLQLQPPFIVSCPICSHKIPWSSHCSFTSPCQTPCPIPSGRGYSFPVRSQTTELLELTEAIRAWCDALELMARQLIPWTLTLSIAGQNDETWKPLEKPLENERKKPGCCGFPSGFSIGFFLGAPSFCGSCHIVRLDALGTSDKMWSATRQPFRLLTSLRLVRCGCCSEKWVIWG